MATKSINLKHDDAVGLADIVEKDPRVGGPSEALRYCFEDAARENPDWQKVIDEAKTLNYDVQIPESDIGVTRTFIVEDDVYSTVFSSVTKQLNMKKPQVSFLTRLCIYAARVKLFQQTKQQEVVIKNIDSLELMKQVCNKTVELIRAGRISEIEKFLEV